ncbi:protein ADM2 [Corvus cornix cornix]|uniref:protein ADM2 n=1 Tax=Corvus cornix cornix TaxID=932674 RepID=UPI00194F58F7|nr:protein ADM2 [Corvus cornix cornix]
MRAPAPLALGCVSFALCLLELPHGRALPPRRDPPARSPPERIPSLPGDPPARGPSGPCDTESWCPARPLGRPRRRLLAPGLPRGTSGTSSCGTTDGGTPPARAAATPGDTWCGWGCVLGTCQVLNLSHRLWQLRGQSGRPPTRPPMNPNSPHSYG